MFCPRCGSELPDGARFCSRCGATLGGEKPTAPTPAPAQQPTGPKPRRRRVVAVVAALLAVLLAGGAAAWWFLLRPRPVWVRATTEPVWTAPEALDGAISQDVIAQNMALAQTVAPQRTIWAYETTTCTYSDRGAILSETTTGGGSITYGLDAEGNAVSSSGSPNGDFSDAHTYDDQGRLVRSESRTGSGTMATYAYADDGSCTVDYYDGDGAKTATAVYDACGGFASQESFYSDGSHERREYDDGFLTHVTFEDAAGNTLLDTTLDLERDASGHVVAVTCPDGSWGALNPPDVLFDRICFEYDENGCVSRMYAPWASPEARARYVASHGTAPNEDNVFDMRYTYERIDDPTPLVRLLASGNNA
ncbi:zinc-ribbon domain-containing protein [Thermophilibacter sp.]